MPDDEVDKKSRLSNTRRAGEQDSDRSDICSWQLCENIVQFMVAFANKQRLLLDDRKFEGLIRVVKYALFMFPVGG